MNRIDLNSIIPKDAVKEFASKLFPHHSYPLAAMKRAMKQEIELSETQISKLAAIKGVSISELFGINWKAAGINKEDETITFTRPGYEAKLNMENFVCSVFKDGELKHSQSLVSKAITLTDFLNYISLIILKLN